MTLPPEHRTVLRRIASRRARVLAEEVAAIKAAGAAGASFREIAAEVDRSKSTVELIIKGRFDDRTSG
jgi:transposase